MLSTENSIDFHVKTLDMLAKKSKKNFYLKNILYKFIILLKKNILPH